jgi:hypothetical protein
MIIDCISDLPAHHQLYVTHNGHNTNYESIQDYLEKWLQDISPARLQLMIESNSVWEIQLYPITPISFYWVAASTLKEATRLMMLNYEDGKWI